MRHCRAAGRADRLRPGIPTAAADRADAHLGPRSSAAAVPARAGVATGTPSPGIANPASANAGNPPHRCAANANINTDGCAHSGSNRRPYANTDAYPRCSPHRHSYRNSATDADTPTNGYTNPGTYSHALAHAYASSHPDARATAHRHPDSNADAGSCPDAPAAYANTTPDANPHGHPGSAPAGRPGLPDGSG